MTLMCFVVLLIQCFYVVFGSTDDVIDRDLAPLVAPSFGVERQLQNDVTDLEFPSVDQLSSDDTAALRAAIIQALLSRRPGADHGEDYEQVEKRAMGMLRMGRAPVERRAMGMLRMGRSSSSSSSEVGLGEPQEKRSMGMLRMGRRSSATDADSSELQQQDSTAEAKRAMGMLRMGRAMGMLRMGRAPSELHKKSMGMLRMGRR